MPRLSKSQILAADDLICKDVDVPEWGGVARLRMLTGTDRNHCLQMLADMGEDADPMEKGMMLNMLVLVHALIDDEGKPLFFEEEIPELNKKSAAVLTRLSLEALELNGMKPKATDEAVKNSEGMAKDGSTSALPAS